MSVRLLIISLLCLLPWSVSAEQPVSTFTLDNGMDVVVIEDNRAPVVTHMVWYRVGAADEPRGVSGIAHFLEHLMFKGTEKLGEGEFSEIVAANGGRDNAFTAQDYTGYHQSIAADRLELVMEMEADRMTGLTLSEEAVATERDVVLEERNQRTENSPGALFGEQIFAALYLNHPYGVPIVGWKHEIEALTREDALEFYRRHYAPDNALLVVAGDVTPDAVRTLAEKYYGPIPGAGRGLSRRPTEPPQLSPRRMEMSDPRVTQENFVRYYLVPGYDAEDPKTSAALYVLSAVLGDGITSRLPQQLQVEQKIALGAGASYSPRSRDATAFSLYAVPAPGRSLEDTEAAVDAVLREMIETGPSQEEIDRVKRVLRASRIFAQDSVSTQARIYGAALAIGLTVEDVQGWPAVVDSVTPQDVRAVAEKYLQLPRSVTGYLRREAEEG
jgi:zinc protease